MGISCCGVGVDFSLAAVVVLGFVDGSSDFGVAVVVVTVVRGVEDSLGFTSVVLCGVSTIAQLTLKL